MTRVTLRRALPLAAATATLAAPALALPAAASAASSYTAAANDLWGRVTVTLRVSGTTVTRVSGSSSYHTGRSAQLDAYALPILKREALRTHSANIHTVSGATYTSEAFIAALRSDRTRAHI